MYILLLSLCCNKAREKKTWQNTSNVAFNGDVTHPFFVCTYLENVTTKCRPCCASSGRAVAKWHVHSTSECSICYLWKILTNKQLNDKVLFLQNYCGKFWDIFYLGESHMELKIVHTRWLNYLLFWLKKPETLYLLT